MGRTQLARLSPFPLEGLSRPEPQPLPSHGPSASSSPFPQLGGGEWAGGRRSRLRSLMISCPHHSFLSHAGGEEEQRQAGSKRGAGTAGHRDRASGSWGTGPSSGSEPRNGRHRPHAQSSEEVGVVEPQRRTQLPAAAAAGSRAGARSVPHPCCCGSASRGCSAAGSGAGALQMEADALSPLELGLLLLPLLVTLLAALCVRCRELPASYESASTESLYPRSILIKPPQITVPRTTSTSYPLVTSFPPLRQPDLLPIPRSPQPLGGSHRMPSSRQDSEDANSVASYENQEPACENVDEDEDEDDYPNEGYLEVLPDSTPAAVPVVSSAPVPSNPGLRDSAFSMESGEDYVNVPESEESAEASLDGSREYVNVSQELQPVTGAELATLKSQEVEDEEEEGVEAEEAPDYENLQELN
ncbi:linker for activation of T-cells family member 1 isoform X2 [Peromyscus leucopus]|uniref:linker for activation of T-cells family member 1 isoform X2 n=1 Tax=Peromyscus leucopus TaxID=10041 RepID=UPI0010A1EF91|nr:linker for activation of T-cells family member 1 isoform X2 [Peromyscus leucopus]